MKKEKQYPCYFISADNSWQMTKYVYIREPNGLVRGVLFKNDKHHVLDGLSESDCNFYVGKKLWRKVTGAELVLII